MTTGAVMLLGVDGGGTSTDVRLATADGRIIGYGSSGPSNAKTVGAERAREALDAAIALAFADANLPQRAVASACFGLAGFDRPDDRLLLARWVEESQWAEHVIQVSDGDLVVACGTLDGCGVGVIAGTGSIAVGRAADGRKARAGGWGPLMGDEGSAYAVVLSALRLVARRADGRETPPVPDRLGEGFLRAFDVATTAMIVPALYAPGFDRARIAALAPIVLEACEHEESLTSRLLAPAGKELGAQAVAVAAALDWPRGPLPLALAGGFLLSAPAVRAALMSEIEAHGYVPLPTNVPEPVLGAVILAARALKDDGAKP